MSKYLVVGAGGFIGGHLIKRLIEENNIRVASVLGLVGAGGLGQLLSFHLGLFLMDKACTVILAMLLLILFVDGLSYSIRRRIY